MNIVATNTLPFEAVVEDVSAGNNKVQKGDYLPAGLYPVVDQGQEFVGGYSDDESNLVAGNGPWIIFGDHTRILKYIDFPFCMGADGVKVLKPRSELSVDAKYLFHFLKANEVPSAGYSRHFKFLRRLEISLPPLDEQRRIAAILDKADALRRKRKRAIELLDGLTQSIFLEMFGDPFAEKNLLRRVDFKDVAVRITYGFTQPMSHRDTGIPILTAKNIRFGYIDFENVAFADRREFESLTAKSKPSRFDILITKDGAIGRSACVLTDEEICINQSVALVKPRLDLVEPLYLLHYLLSGPVQARIESMKKGNAMPHLQITELARFPVALPSLHLQRKFVSRLGVVLGQEERVKKSLREGGLLFSSLEHRAFSGHL